MIGNRWSVVGLSAFVASFVVNFVDKARDKAYDKDARQSAGPMNMSTKTTLFSAHPYLQKRWKAVGRKLAFAATTRAGWQAWRRRTLRKLKDLTGYDTMQRTAPKPRITEERDFGSYRRQRVEIRTSRASSCPSTS